MKTKTIKRAVFLAVGFVANTLTSFASSTQFKGIQSGLNNFNQNFGSIMQTVAKTVSLVFGAFGIIGLLLAYTGVLGDKTQDTLKKNILTYVIVWLGITAISAIFGWTSWSS